MVQVADLNVIPQRFLVIAYGVRVDAVLPSVLVAFVSLGGLAAMHPTAAIGHCLRLARLATAGFGSAVCHSVTSQGIAWGVFTERSIQCRSEAVECATLGRQLKTWRSM